ncbi:MAG: endonuclease/exonuclease/phosphatase family protein [Bacteriovorax sp.]|nr:endonuclease/exonuclease/phosphatase family protein [Bacteriovorax sp.]
MVNLKLITSNIRFANSGDGIHDWSARRPLLVEIYKNFDTDLLGTQEGRYEQIKELDAGLENLVLIDNHRNWIDERMYPCLFINPETIAVHASGDIWLSATPDVSGSSSFESAFPRLCTWAEISMKSSGLKMMIVNTHLDHILHTTRVKQIEVLINEIRKINQHPILIMGDFNESPLTEIREKLISAFKLKDPWSEKRYPEETSHHGFLGDKTIGDRIDWILIPEKFECSELRMEKRSFANGVYPSDHYPLLATVIPK